MFQAELDHRCQRGLHWRYVVDEAWRPRADAFRDLRARLLTDSTVVHLEQAWGDQPVHCFVKPFRYELRMWTRPGELSFLHRASASPEERTDDRARFEAILAQWLETCRQRA